MRDNKTEEAKRNIGEGAKVRMDEKGNIHIKRVSKSNIYVKNTADENGIGNDILKLPQGALEFGKGFLVSVINTLNQLHCHLPTALLNLIPLQYQHQYNLFISYYINRIYVYSRCISFILT